MSIKTTIKNDLWRWNYIIPFIKKHQFDEKGKIDVIKHVMNAYKTIHPVKASNRSVGNDTRVLLMSVDITVDANSRFVYFIDTTKTIAVPGNILSNFTLDYDKIIHGAFVDLVPQGNDEYSREAQAVAEGIDDLRKRIIEIISEDTQIEWFNRILEKPAEHFDEALQRILFFNQILWQTRHRLNGLGRLDKILVDLYEKDGLDKNQAKNLILDFFSQLSKYKEYKSDALMGDIGQIVILGGVDRDTYFCNDLTYVFLEAQAELNKPDPKTFLRVSKKMPDELLKTGIKCLRAKTGSPLFSNDDVVVPILREFGIDEADDYCVSACWEPFIVGRSMDQNNIAVFDYFPALDEVLKEDINTWEKLVERYIEKNKENFISFENSVNGMKWAKDPLVSMFTDGCNEKKVDISEGSAKYNNYGVTTVAISNVVDSILNAKQLMSDGRSLRDINAYREEVTGRYFGHDEKDAIELANKITASIANEAEQFKNTLGGTIKFGYSSPAYNILSKGSASDVSGKKAGEPYNTHISCIDAQYTEVVNFSAQLDYSRQRFNGNVVDFFASSSTVADEKFFIFMKAAVKIGFFQMQLNVMDSKTLIDAKNHPEKYPGLIVRVWGFSAYFNELPESYKDLLIERAIAAENVA